MGREAVWRYGVAPFVDFSCRREPDLEHPSPAITGLCRPGFVRRLRPGDVVAYMTVKGLYGETQPHWRLVAILEVRQYFRSHAEAAVWYRGAGLPLPRNLLVPGNPPQPFDRTGGPRGPDRDRIGDSTRAWDGLYRTRARRSPTVATTRPLFRELHRPPAINMETMRRVFGRVPVTRNAARISIPELVRLTEACGVQLRPLA